MDTSLLSESKQQRSLIISGHAQPQQQTGSFSTFWMMIYNQMVWGLVYTPMLAGNAELQIIEVLCVRSRRK
jgi:hypothetical protein